MNDLGWPWTAKTRSCWKISFYGAHQKNLTEDRPKILAAKWRQWFYFLEILGICGYSLGFLTEGRQTAMGLSNRVIFIVCYWLYNYYVRKLHSICRTYIHERDCVSKTAAHSDISVYRRHRNLLTYLLTFTYDTLPFDGFSAILKCMT